MIAIVDYGMGNLRSVQKAFERVGGDARIVTSPEEIATAEKVVLPGVGAFRDAIGQLRSHGLVEPIKDAIRSGRPFLGICLGLQLLFDVSYEDGEYAGLGVLPGKVVRFDFSGLPEVGSLKIPQMGWNQLQWTAPCPLLEGIAVGTHFYFVHSYYVVPAASPSPSAQAAVSGSSDTAAQSPGPLGPALMCATCNYGRDFTAMVWRDNLFATQFHPEKSQAAGLALLRNFAAL
jgi:glutamine amidotransferase